MTLRRVATDEHGQFRVKTRRSEAVLTAIQGFTRDVVEGLRIVVREVVPVTGGKSVAKIEIHCKGSPRITRGGKEPWILILV